MVRKAEDQVRAVALGDELTNDRIRLATYNVNDKLPPPGTTELTPMVGAGDEDILVFGFQEVGKLPCAKGRERVCSHADLRSQALLLSQGNVRAEEWEAAILRELKDKAGAYVKVRVRSWSRAGLMADCHDSIRRSRHHCASKAVHPGGHNKCGD